MVYKSEKVRLPTTGVGLLARVLKSKFKSHF